MTQNVLDLQEARKHRSPPYRKFELWQIPIDRHVSERINSGLEKEFYERYLKSLLGAEVEEAVENRMYKHVADVYASDLDHAFQVGNIGPDNQVLRHAPMHSISVGDILVGSGVWAVDSIGFRQLDITVEDL